VFRDYNLVIILIFLFKAFAYTTLDKLLTIFLPRDAMLSAVYAIVVRLSVCHTPVLYQNG